jgi:hypothetical protein
VTAADSIFNQTWKGNNFIFLFYFDMYNLSFFFWNTILSFLTSKLINIFNFSTSLSVNSHRSIWGYQKQRWHQYLFINYHRPNHLYGTLLHMLKVRDQTKQLILYSIILKLLLGRDKLGIFSSLNYSIMFFWVNRLIPPVIWASFSFSPYKFFFVWLTPCNIIFFSSSSFLPLQGSKCQHCRRVHGVKWTRKKKFNVARGRVTKKNYRRKKAKLAHITGGINLFTLFLYKLSKIK